MFTKLTIAFCVVALAAAFAGSVPTKAPSYRVTLNDQVTVSGVALKPGEYKVTVNAAKATFVLGKSTQEVAVKVEENEKKFSDTQVIVSSKDGKNQLTQINVAGTKTKLMFN